MHNLTLVGRLFSLLFFVGAAFPAHAQQSPGNTGGGFCALAGTDLLAALDGSWTIQQGAGAAVGGNMTIPLPPSSAPVSLNFDPVSGIIDIDSADLADGMIMFPTAPIQQGQANKILGTQGSAKSSGSGCDWKALPSLIGTNRYTAIDKTSLNFVQTSLFCTKAEDKDFVDFGVDDVQYALCSAPPQKKPKSKFEMEMTLVLRFDSANFGSGTVSFDGEADYPGNKGTKIRFLARAPVELVR